MHNSLIKKSLISLITVTLIIGAFNFFGDSPSAEASSNEQQEGELLQVKVESVKKEAVEIWKSYSGRLKAVNKAEIKPQVSGRISEVRFKDGQSVNKGDVLFVIDPRPYKASVSSAEAELLTARSQAELAGKELERARGLIKTDAISKGVLDKRLSNFGVTEAAVQAAEARLEQAKIDLDYAYLKSPIHGRVSRIEVTEGNLVEAGPNAPLLTSVVSNDAIYADFEVDEFTYLNTIRSVAKDLQSENKIPVELHGNLDHVFYEGFIHSFDNSLNVTSGTIRARALFNNGDRTLLPGMFVTIKLKSPKKDKQILITEKAIGTNQDRKFVYVVGDDNIVTYREVAVGDSSKGKRVILSGLESGDLVITEGLMKIRPGMPVNP